MKTLITIVGIIVVCVVVAVGVLRITGYPPHDRTPGLWLKGQLVTTPVQDWTFIRPYPTDQVEVHPWYGIAHSVNTGHLVANGQLYLTSGFPEGMPFPQGKAWTEAVMRNPNVVIKVGDKLYDAKAYPVTDPAEQARILQTSRQEIAEAQKNGVPPPPPATVGLPPQPGSGGRMTMHLFHVVQN